MCLKTPKAPKAIEPKLPLQPITQAKPADFAENEEAIGFGQTGRSGGRALRIKRPRKQNAFGNVGGGGLSIGTQVPGV